MIIVMNRGIKPTEYYKGNGVYGFSAEETIDGKLFRFYYFKGQVFMEIDNVPQKDFYMGIEPEDSIKILHDGNILIKYAKILLDKYCKK